VPDPLLEWSGAVLGGCEVTGDSSWPHRLSRILTLRDESGGGWVVKQHRHLDRYQAELSAYQRWVPALGDRAARLRAYSGELGALVISVVPGELVPWPSSQARPGELDLHRDAGAALALLHRAKAPAAGPDLGAAKTAELDQLAPLAAGLLSRRELAFARSQAAALTSAGNADLVPCHHDYTPRNWLTSGGTVRIIDFEWARLDVPLADLARLYLGLWPGRPDLRAAFLDGYGHLSDAAATILRRCAAVTAVWLIVKAHESGQPSFEEASRAALARLQGMA
jgi:hypothetical protein